MKLTAIRTKRVLQNMKSRCMWKLIPEPIRSMATYEVLVENTNHAVVKWYWRIDSEDFDTR